jgi:hypothetical protein
MLIVDAELIRKIDDNRGDMSRSEFINFIIDSKLAEAEEGKKPVDYVDYVKKEEFIQFGQGMKELLRNFLEFFLSYGLELGTQPKDKAFEELTRKIQAFEAREKKV